MRKFSYTAAVLCIFLCIALGQTLEKSQRLGSEYFKHDMPVRGVAFSPDNVYIVSGDEKFVTLWDRNSGEKIKNIGKVEHGITDLQYTPCGKQIALEDSC